MNTTKKLLLAIHDTEIELRNNKRTVAQSQYHLKQLWEKNNMLTLGLLIVPLFLGWKAGKVNKATLIKGLIPLAKNSVFDHFWKKYVGL